jgi:class 3 adenylate cyclase
MPAAMTTAMMTTFDPSNLTMTEIIRLQTVLSQELTRRFERAAALAFTDIVDSTPYFAQFGNEAGRKLQQLHFDLLQQCTPAHAGRIVDTAGDGAFACFPSAASAANAMMALQNLVSSENVSRSPQHQLSVRIGMHWGHVLTDDVQVTGDAVNLCARLAATAQPSQIRLTREMFQELEVDQRRLCWPLGAAALKGIGRSVELMALLWRDPSRFPSQVMIRESGECIVLPPHDTVCFGRRESQEGTSGHDVVLGLPNALATKQISRRHFELRSRPEGYVLKALTTQATEVDGVTMQRDQEVPVRPGSIVRLAGVMTLDFVSTGLVGAGAIDETMCAPGVTVVG